MEKYMEEKFMKEALKQLKKAASIVKLQSVRL